ncbi:hypothetical protein HMPREF3052_05425 [Neisseria sp. HMSC056A03]|uniref:hypothetical protein n=1 Tax=Neisseria sp. HMSC056A03 TaxID=1739544 RepID=UPI0008A31821|nr:hypothetical protein [Neisseria sp. HMSC056A03]OFO28724.1 hypothetical protein HMPREF3052_05425 [Neisseria sp. HMSC056A03]
MKIKMQRTFYPVGQGGFYSESFKTENNNFNVVYDCGSLSRGVDKVISNSFDKNEDIDILFISHFDSDHVNKINILKNSVGKIKTVIMPLLFEEDKDFLLFVYKGLGIGYKNSLDILNNPKEFFGSETKIIWVREVVESRDEESNQEIRDVAEIEDGAEIESGENISFSLRGQKFWIYKPYNYKNKIRCKELIKKFRENNISIRDLKDVGYVANHTKEIRKCYKEVDGDINQNSLVLYSNFIEYKYSTAYIDYIYIRKDLEFYSFGRDYFDFFYTQFNIGCIYTGDVHLKTIVNDFKNKIKGCKHYLPVNTIQVPHHGSKNGFDIDFFNDFSEGRLGIISPISFGLSNPYGHPSSMVIKQLTLEHHLPVYVTNDKRDLFTQVFKFLV